jgi:diketogulonate reductase-like aldo/keto reductase
VKLRRFGPPSLAARGDFLVPIVGQGTWPTPDRDALRRGIDLGLTHIDTAEMYGNGRSEEIVGEAIAPYPRESLFVVTKVLPSNATANGVARACERSLRRLKTDYLDCYLLHWRGEIALEETLGAFEQLLREGKIRSLGVSNFDPWDLREAATALRSEPIACNQVLYNLGERTPEAHELLWARENESAFVAYTPLARPPRPLRQAQGDMTLTAEPIEASHPELVEACHPELVEGRRIEGLGEDVLTEIAHRHRVTPEAVALAFLLRHPLAFAIPKANTLAHVEANAAAGDLELDPSEIAAIDAAYPARERTGPLPTN